MGSLPLYSRKNFANSRAEIHSLSRMVAGGLMSGTVPLIRPTRPHQSWNVITGSSNGSRPAINFLPFSFWSFPLRFIARSVIACVLSVGTVTSRRNECARMNSLAYPSPCPANLSDLPTILRSSCSTVWIYPSLLLNVGRGRRPSPAPTERQKRKKTHVLPAVGERFIF